MTRVKVLQKGTNILSIELDGHTDYGMEGEDIVCAGLSCISQTACLGLLTVANVNAEILRDEERGYLKVSLPNNLTKEQMHDSQMILRTALIGIQDLREGFSKFISLEVKKDVY